ncbi:MAG: Yip1 family protein [Desulfobaccales bacterium]
MIKVVAAGIIVLVVIGFIVFLISLWFKGEITSKKCIVWIIPLFILGIIAGLIGSEFKPLSQPRVITQPEPPRKIEPPEKPKPIPPKPQPQEQPLPPKAPPGLPSQKAILPPSRPTEPKEVPKTKAPTKEDDGGISIGNPEKYPKEQSKKWPVQMFIVLNGKNESVEGTVIGPTPWDGVFYPVYVGLNRKTINSEEMAEIRRQLRHR